MLFKLYLMFLFILITIAFSTQSRKNYEADYYDYYYGDEFDCSLPKSSGDSSCNAHSSPKFYFDKDKKCKKFIYSGCGGNSNRFSSKKACMRVCDDEKYQNKLKKKRAHKNIKRQRSLKHPKFNNEIR